MLEWIEWVLHRCWSLCVKGFHFVVSIIVPSECLLHWGQHIEKQTKQQLKCMKDGLLVVGKRLLEVICLLNEILVPQACYLHMCCANQEHRGLPNLKVCCQ